MIKTLTLQQAQLLEFDGATNLMTWCDGKAMRKATEKY
jgi:hypothetical protein